MMWGSATALDTRPSLGAKPVELQVEVGTTDSFETSLGSGMRSLYKDSLFFDVVLAAGGQKFPAHKVVLAATSAAFRERLEQAVAAAEAAPLEERPENTSSSGNKVENPNATETEKTDAPEAHASVETIVPLPELPKPTAEVAQPVELTDCRTPEIHFPNVSNPRAISILLEHIYGIDEGLVDNYSVSDDATNKDVLQLANDLQLTTLKDFATHWMTKDLTSANIFLRLSIAQEFALHSFFEGASGALASDMSALRAVTDDLTIVDHPGILQAILMRVASSLCPASITKKSGEQRPTKRARIVASAGA